METYHNMHPDYSGPGGEYGGGPDYQAPLHSVSEPQEDDDSIVFPIVALLTFFAVVATVTVAVSIALFPQSHHDQSYVDFPGRKEGDLSVLSGTSLSKNGIEVVASELSEKRADDGVTVLCSTVSVANLTEENYYINVYNWTIQLPDQTIDTVNTVDSEPSAYKGLVPAGSASSGELCFRVPSEDNGSYVLFYQDPHWESERLGWVTVKK